MTTIQEDPGREAIAARGTVQRAASPDHMKDEMRSSSVRLLSMILDSSSRASALMPWNKPGPIVLPDNAEERADLLHAHIEGGPARVLYAPQGKAPERICIDRLVLAAISPAEDGLCRWLAIDLDAAGGHGDGGLIDPTRALAAIAERADEAGLLPGLLAARSKSGRGRHLWIIPPEPQAVDIAALAVAALCAMAFTVAERDAGDNDGELLHAFTTGTGEIAFPGRPVAVELFPRATDPPEIGWALTLPGAGAFAVRGGGIPIDPFTDRPVALADVPRCEAAAWSRFVDEAQTELARRQKLLAPTWRGPSFRTEPTRPALHPETERFLRGDVAPGSRNAALFAAVCNLIGVGIDRREAARLALNSARACGLPEGESLATISSALRRKGAA